MRYPLLLALLFSLSALPASAARDVIDLKGDAATVALKETQTALQQNPNDVDALKAAGILLHQMSRSNAEKAKVEQGESYLKTATRLAPQDLEASAWLGSITTMKALFESDPGKQTLWVKMGSRMMDGAVQKQPDNGVIRLIRAYNSMELPPFMKRTRFAVEDFKAYLAQCQQKSCPAATVADAKAKLKQAEQIVASAQ